jgi:hypothetical protein
MIADAYVDIVEMVCPEVRFYISQSGSMRFAEHVSYFHVRLSSSVPERCQEQLVDYLRRRSWVHCEKVGQLDFHPQFKSVQRGAFKQRAEIMTPKFSPRHKGTYEFSINVKMLTNAREQFSIFSLHDGHGKHVGHHCAPPFQLYIMPDGRFLGRSGYLGKDGKTCTGLTLGRSATLFDKTGKAQQLSIVLDFDSTGEFDVYVYIDGRLEISGRNKQPVVQAMRSREFFFKHGVYSSNMFDYRMTSENVKVRRVRLQ